MQGDEWFRGETSLPHSSFFPLCNPASHPASQLHMGRHSIPSIVPSLADPITRCNTQRCTMGVHTVESGLFLAQNSTFISPELCASKGISRTLLEMTQTGKSLVIMIPLSFPPLERISSPVPPRPLMGHRFPFSLFPP